jgi:MFS family permease
MFGCLGCAVAQDVITLNMMRALTGVGGGGLMTMGKQRSASPMLIVLLTSISATIINSDMIPFRERGMYQAAQNVLHGFGSICGASLGGLIADTIGWRWCFFLQVPVSAFALLVGHLVIKRTAAPHSPSYGGIWELWKKVDLLGSLLLILGLSSQLAGLSLGGNELPWNNPWVISSLVVSVVLLALFLFVEGTTSAIPIIPLRMLRGWLALSTQLANVCVGMAAYAVSRSGCLGPYSYLTLPVPLHASAFLPGGSPRSRLKGRCSFNHPFSGYTDWWPYRRHRHVSLGPPRSFSTLGRCPNDGRNALMILLKFTDASWKYILYIIPANLGQGIVYPGILFTVLAAFDHDGES